MIHWVGNTVVRIDKINAIRHNSWNDLGPTNIIELFMDDAQSTKIDIVMFDFEHASDEFDKIAEKLEEFYIEKGENE